MIKPDITHVKDIHEFYRTLKSAQEREHGRTYTGHHDALIKCAKECEVIKEIGVCQGGTLAALLLTNPKKLTGIDIEPKYFNPYKHHFEKYAKENGIDFEYRVIDSHDEESVSECDMLHIDSLHRPDHLMGELKRHAKHVRKYIVFHDTANARSSFGLFKTIAEYITFKEQQWSVVDHFIHNVGYTVIKRVNREEA